MTSNEPIQIRPVGRVESELIDPADAPNQGMEGGVDAWLVFDPTVADALGDLKVGDRIVVITWLHRAPRDVLRTYPGSDVDAPHRGVFSLRSPERPNPIGLHPVEILAVRPGRILVNHLEAIDGTPILDVKPLLR